jgi:membrane-associated phospholipid phosphatase
LTVIKRISAYAAFFLVWSVGYAVAPLVSVTTPNFLAWDPVYYLPVLSPFVLPYLSFFAISVAVFIGVEREDDLWLLTKCLIGIVLVSSIVYVLWPTAIVRPAITAEWHFGGWLLKLVHETDTNGNCFPSEHVSISAFCAYALGRLRPRLRWLWWLWAAAIVLSTVFTRQHYVADVIGCLLVAGLAALAFHRSRR